MLFSWKKLASAVVIGIPVTLATTPTSATAEAPVVVKAAMECSHDPGARSFSAIVTMPRSEPTGSTFHARIDGVPSGAISQTGLNYIREMVTDYLLPAGATYVADSIRIVPETGTPNARAGARAWHDGAGIHVELPARIDNGMGYTPPSVEFDLKVDAPAGTVLALRFAHYEVTANVIVLGDLHSACDPKPKPYTIGETVVLPAAAP